MTSLRERKKIVAEIPWVTVLDVPVPCDALRWSELSIRAIHDPTLRERYRCKLRARYRFEALGPAGPIMLVAASGIYCWRHLLHTGLYGSMEEEERTVRWLRRHHPELFADEKG